MRFDKMISWERQEPGWYTSYAGAIVQERDGWWFYPVAAGKPNIGQLPTLKAAKAMASLQLPSHNRPSED